AGREEGHFGSLGIIEKDRKRSRSASRGSHRNEEERLKNVKKESEQSEDVTNGECNIEFYFTVLLLYNDETYNSCMRDYLRKLERWENSPKKVARDLKNREIFERAFPEMKRTREEKERSCRTDRISLRGQDTLDEQPAPSEKGQVDEEYKMRNAAAIPPLIIHESSIRPRFFDNEHAIIKNAAEENRNWIETFLSSWSDDEKKLFRERLSAVGKNYANIAMFLENKTVKDCVLYYYLCKKRENFKAVIPKRKRKLAKTYKPPVMPSAEELAMYQLVPQDALTETQSNASQDSKCVMCQLRIDPTTNPGRVLTRSNYEMYDIDKSRSRNMVQEVAKEQGVGGKTFPQVELKLNKGL
ncbi:Myb-like DNA-binding domain protein, partial [Cooperia oncophora]